MGTDVSKSYLRGLLVPDLRLGYDSIADSSSYEQAGPLPGVPEPFGETEMVLEASGTQSPDRELRIRATKAGQPEPDGGAFAWRNAGDTLWRGWDGPHQISYFESLDYTTTANKWQHPHAITLASGAVVCVVMKSSRYTVAQVRNPTTGAWVEVSIHDNGAAYARAARPTVLALPSGRLLCFFWQEDALTATNNVRMHFSDDDGATWALGARAVLTDDIDNAGVTKTPKTLRAAYLNGQILLVMWITDTAIAARADVLYQFASNDLGASFDLVDGWSGAADDSWAGFPSLFAANGQFFLHYITRDLATTGIIVPYQRRIANAYQLLASAPAEIACLGSAAMTWGTFAGGPPLSFTAGELTSWADEDGVLYLAGQNFDAAGGALRECFVQRSIDNGATWRGVGSSDASWARAPWWAGRDVATYPKEIAGTSQGGRAVLLHSFAAAPDTHDDSLCATYLGGFTTVTLPQLNVFPSPAERVSWARTWLPFDLPENTGGVWTLVPAGAPGVTMTSGGLRVTGVGGDVQSYALTVAPTSTHLQGMIALLDLRVVAGSGFVDLRSGIAGPSSYTIRVTVSTTAITLRDMVAGADIATIATTAGVTGVQVLLAVGDPDVGVVGGYGAAWYRPTGSGTDRAFVTIGTSTTLAIGASTTNQMGWGNISAGTTDVYFRQACYTFGTYAGKQLYAGNDNPEGLQGRTFSPSPVYVDDGVKIAAVDGPVFFGDNWHLDTRYEYGIENVFHEVSPSPARGWRSIGTAVEQLIAVQYEGAPAGERVPGLEPMIGIGLFEINFRTCYLEGYNGATWDTLATIDSATLQNELSFTRQGDTVFPQPLPAAYTGARDWFTYHVLADSYFQMVGEQGEISWDVIKKIRTNGEGVFSNSVTKPTRIALYDVQPGDPSGAIAFEVSAIMSKDVVCIVNNATRYTALRLRIPPQETCEGYFKIGTMLLGHVVTFSWQYSRGRALNVEPNTALVTSRSGLRRSRRLGKPRRSVEMAWTDGADVTQATRATPTPDYTTGYTGSAVPVGTPYDTPYTVAGVAEQLSGAASPVVYLAGFERPAVANTAIVLNNRNTFLLSRLVSPVRLESRLGSEWGNPGELFNVATITLEEEV